MKTNLESRYLVLKRITAYYPSTIFLRNSILKIAKEHELITIRGIVYTTNRVSLFLILSSCAFCTIEAVYFFTTKENKPIKFYPNSIIYLLNLDFNPFLLIKFIFKIGVKILKKIYILIEKTTTYFPILIRTFSIKSTISFSKSFFSRIGKNTANLILFPITGSAFVLDKVLEPIEIRWFYRSLPISKNSPFFFR